MGFGLQDTRYVVHRPADQRRPILYGLGHAVGDMRLFFCHVISRAEFLKLQLSSLVPCLEIATPSSAAITIGPAPRLLTIEPKKKLHWATRTLFGIALLILFLDLLSLLIIPQMVRHGGIYDMFNVNERGQVAQSIIALVRRARS